MDATGTYRVSAAASKRSDSLWIGARFADRTKAVTVRAETHGRVTFRRRWWIVFSAAPPFEEGAHDQVWDGFRFANGEPTQTGVIVIGGSGGGYAGLAAPHPVTQRNISIAGSATSTYAGSGDRSIFPWAHLVWPRRWLLRRVGADGLADVGLSGLALGEYLEIFRDSGMVLKHLEVNNQRSPLARLIEPLRAYTPLRELLSYSIYAVLERPQFRPAGRG